MVLRDRRVRESWDFILRGRRDGGGFAPSAGAQHGGELDTRLSDLAAVTCAAVLPRTPGRELPQPERPVAFHRRHERPDGRFFTLAGNHDPGSVPCPVPGAAAGTSCRAEGSPTGRRPGVACAGG